MAIHLRQEHSGLLPAAVRRDPPRALRSGVRRRDGATPGRGRGRRCQCRAAHLREHAGGPRTLRPLLSRASTAFFGTSSALATPEIQAIEEEYAPKLAAHSDAILPVRFYERIRAVRDDTAQMGALDRSPGTWSSDTSPSSRWPVWVNHAAKERLRVLNAALATLTTRFSVSCSPTPTTSPCSSTTSPGSMGSPPARFRPRARRPGRHHHRLVPHQSRPADQPPALGLLDQPRPASPAPRRPASPWQSRQRTRHEWARPRRSSGFALSEPGSWAMPPTPRPPWPTRPRAHRTGSVSDSPRWPAPQRPTPRRGGQP